MMPGFVITPCIPSSAARSLSYRTAAVDETDTNSYSFASQDFGTADANRHLIIAITGEAVSGSIAISSVTIGGVSATITVQASSDDATKGVAGIAIAAVPSGATGTVAVTFNANARYAGIAVWAAYNLASATAVDTASSTSGTADPTSLNVDTAINDFVIAVGRSDNASSAAWTGVTKRFDLTYGGTDEHTGGDHTATTAETPRTVQYNMSSAGRACGVAAVFR